MARLLRPVVEDPTEGVVHDVDRLSAETAAYYGRLAGEYTRAFPDWEGATERQAEVLDRLIRSVLGPGPLSILDCTCGIGTQAVGLARRGHDVCGTDISAQAIDEARRNAQRRGVSAHFAIADVRRIGESLDSSFDVVISADNSLPHVLTDSGMRDAVAGMYQRLEPGGLLMMSMRDYDRHLVRRPEATQPQVWSDSEAARVSFQTWTWLNGNLYRATLFLLDRKSSGWEMATHEGATFRAWRRSEITAFLEEAGFSEIEWRDPSSTLFHQPIVTCRAGGRRRSVA